MMQRFRQGLLLTGILFYAMPVRADLVDDPSEDMPAAPTSANPQKQQHPASGTADGLIDVDGPSKVRPKQNESNPEGAVKTEVSPTKSVEPRKTGKSDKNNANNEPVKFWSKVFSGQNKEGILVLEEDVVVTQGDLRIAADKATLYADKATNEWTKVVAVGNVFFSKKDPETGLPVTAESREAIFDNAARTVVLKGDPKLNRGTDVVRGKQITYDLNTGWVKATRVEGVVQATKQEPAKPDATKSDAVKTDTKKGATGAKSQ